MQMQAKTDPQTPRNLFITTEAPSHSCTKTEVIPEDRVELVVNPPTNMTFRLTQPEQIRRASLSTLR
ncbi:hypothetical protein N7488_012025 [Penicillium malachiteum]|nr:hypothetical protein N7488_012025 [Penicillium malachiteum]